MAIVVRLHVNTAELDEMGKFSIRCRRRGAVALQRVVANVSLYMHDKVKQAYERGIGVAELSKGAKRKRLVGKTMGYWPPVKRYTSTKPLYRSGSLAKAVDWRTTAGGREGWVFVNNKFGDYHGGGTSIPLGAIADVNEFPKTRLIFVTTRMQRYLGVLFQGATRPRKPYNYENKLTGKTMLIKTPARPVWGLTFNANFVDMGNIFISSFLEALGYK